MIKYKYIYGSLGLLACLLVAPSCSKQYEPRMEKPTDVRISDDLRSLKELLCDADFGWQLHYSLGGRYEYMIYEVATFFDDNTVTLLTNQTEHSEKPISSEYKLIAESGLQLQFSTYNDNWMSFATPTPSSPQGLGADLELNLVSISDDKNEIVFEGKRLKGKMTLRRLEKPIRSFKALDRWRALLDELRRRDNYTTLRITAGLEGISPEKPMSVDLELSPIARIVDFKYNVGEPLVSGRKMLYFDHEGMGFSTPIEVGGKSFQHMRWSAERNTFEIDGSPLQGYIESTSLPSYHLPKMYEDFMNKFSMQIVASFGELNKLSRQMKSTTPLIKQAVLCTQYQQRIPVLDEKGDFVYDEVYNHDYRRGELLGNGLYLCFDDPDQFYGYFIPLEFERVESDVIRFRRSTLPMRVIVDPSGRHSVSEDEARAAFERGRKDIDAYIDYLCNDDAWLMRKTQESGRIDWDFLSLKNPRTEYFISRLK